ncbi:MAG TPA: cupin domain-containing protein [Beijerinckiaceae bacterium]|jgi:quercetin dioxygenase-like cupin family protein
MNTKILIALAPLLACPSAALAEEHHAAVQPSQLKWAAPAAYGPGAMMAVVRGDPTKPGTYIVRLKAPAGFRIAPHTHPNDENVTVRTGSFNIGTGDKFDESRGVRVETGGYSFVMKGMTHYAWFTEDTEIQLHGTGPQGVAYVNPADDPRNR